MCLCGAGLTEILKGLAFVGMADAGLALVQHGTRLYLLDVAALSRDMFYQQVLLLWYCMWYCST